MNGFDERKDGSHQKVVNLVGKNKVVLELGCGKGYVSERLKQNGCKVTGIDISKKDVARAKKFCDKVIVGNVETIKLPFKPETFDVVIFGDVLDCTS